MLGHRRRAGGDELNKWLTTLTLFVSAIDKLSALDCEKPHVLYGVVEESGQPLGGASTSLMSKSAVCRCHLNTGRLTVDRPVRFFCHRGRTTSIT